MQIIRASAMGLCFGVRDALRTARGIERPAEVTIHGELVHNPVVLVQLESAGFQKLAESERHQLPRTSAVLVSAHGISERERDRLLAAGKELFDTTCPLVRRVHDSAQRLAREGFHVLLIGRPGHVEVRGIVEDLDCCDVIASVDDVMTWPHNKLGVICQTTTPPRLAADVVAEIRRRNPDAAVRFENTICQPTIERQSAIHELCSVANVVVVVGGTNSNNTRQLVELARELGVPAWQVESSVGLQAEWFRNCTTVGLTAGTSTLDETVDEVHAALTALSSAKNQARVGTLSSSLAGGNA